MSFRLKFFATILLPCLLLIGCGGGSDSGLSSSNVDSIDSGGDPDSGTDSGTDPDDNGPDVPPAPLNTTYVPLMVYEAYKEFSGFEEDGRFSSPVYDPFIEAFLINPVDATMLEPIDTAVVSDYEVTVDGFEISEYESFPRLQKVIGIPTLLKTALVFDVSGSVADVDIDALVAEAKAYIATAKASTNPTIATQFFTVWAFGTEVKVLTTGFTDDTAALEAALDQVAIGFKDKNMLGETTNLHRAIVESIGRYKDDKGDYDYRDIDDTDDEDYVKNNDLFDRTTRDFVLLSQLVLFSSGGPVSLEMDQDLMTRAIQSQSFISYDQDSSAADGSVKLYKPVFYYVVGGTSNGDSYDALSDLSETTTQLVLSAGAYSFRSDLVQKQIAAIDRRIDLDNAHVYSYAFAPRTGDHTRIFRAKSASFNYALTTSYKDEDFDDDDSPGTPAQMLSSLVEITGPNGEYLAFGSASLSEVTTFAPATRWVNTPYAAGDYTWLLTGGVGILNADGTYTVNSIVGSLATLTLTNDLLEHEATIYIIN